MIRYVLRRLFQAIPLLFVITVLSFLLVRLAPGDPTQIMINPRTRPEDREKIRANLGLDKPLHVQYGIWLKNLVLHGELGYSMINGRPVLMSILERMPATLYLMGSSFLLSIVLAVPLGIFSAIRQYTVFDYAVTIFCLIGLSVPPFWLALMAIYLFSLRLQCFPAMGMSSFVEADLMSRMLDLGWHLVLPVAVLTLRNLASWSRYMRSSLLDVVREDYIRTAYSKGLSEAQVILRHALKNALLPMLTILGLSLPDVFAGAFVVEYIFAWPGMGRLGMEAVFHRDYSLLMGDILISSVLVVLANLLADISYAWADPRVRIE